ncbi:6,7-dimethyl-8-ribityllumazine synthase [Cohaesibacter gelatinilyticus]|uniref:6,7-dimethyl-8-ribityllumazine synthase n=1 Tax=Cohaesibacter gelatinilyticus TaxID=372072 RepID=A0A285PH38_9HYPH|nr:6,7-dimethyl-8-ribityllumazine synthase [Cohaesibacter gelatinilyticus]SNZ21024.1 6,7-dimethyl-8-ribityllumazine synthase [Cohaesibacter gelatinilyticus]
MGINFDAIDAFDVAGDYEIPLQAKLLARSGEYDAIIACALVVDEGIYRHDFVATAVIDGVTRAQLDSGVPVLSVTSTPYHFHGHDGHLTYCSRHFVTNGAETAEACMTTLGNLPVVKIWVG